MGGVEVFKEINAAGIGVKPILELIESHSPG